MDSMNRLDQLEDLIAATAWREGDRLVVDALDPLLPERCVKCNAPTDYLLRRRFAWHHPALYLTLLAGVLPYLIVGLASQRRMVLYVPLCDAHRRQRQNLVIAAWLLLVLGLVALVGASTLGVTALAWLGLLLLIASLVTAVVVGMSVLRPVRIDVQAGAFKGAGPGFLASLPAPVDLGE